MVRKHIFPKKSSSKLVSRQALIEKVSYLASTSQKGQGTVINIVGDAGVGKSRLIQEIKALGVLDPFLLIESRAVQLDDKVGFFPLIEIIKNLAGVLESDKEESAREKLKSFIYQMHPERSGELYPFIATLVGYELFDKDAERVRGITGRNLSRLIFKSIRELIIRRSQISPLVFILEDLHWSDTSSIEFLVAFYKLAEDLPILFINLFRPLLGTMGEKLLGFIREDHPNLCVEILVKNLDLKGTGELVENLLSKPISSAFRETLFEVSAGNPLHIEHLIQKLTAADEIKENSGEYELTEPIRADDKAQDLTQLVQQRVESYGVSAREVLDILSVGAGQVFFPLLELLASDTVQLNQAMEQLEQEGMISISVKSLEIKVDYSSQWVKAIVYEMLSADKKRELHLKMATAGKTLFSYKTQGYNAFLARHYQRGGEPQQAVKYLILAGDTAFNSSAFGRALSFYKKAVGWVWEKKVSTLDLEQLSVLEEKIGLIYYHRGYYVEALDFFDRALGHMHLGKKGHKVGNPFKLFYYVSSLLFKLFVKEHRSKKIPTEQDERYFRIYIYQGRVLSCTEPKRMFVDLIKGINESFQYDISKSKVLLHATSSASLFFSYSGLSLRLSQKIIQYVNKKLQGADHGVYNYLMETAQLFYNLASGNWDLKYLERIIDQGLYYGDIFDASANMLFIGNIFVEKGCFAQVDKVINKFKEVSGDFNDPLIKYNWKILVTHYLLKNRKLSEASLYAQEADIIGYKIGLGVDRINVLGMKLQAEVIRGDMKAAFRTKEEIDELIKDEKWYLPQYYMSYLIGALRYHINLLKTAIEDQDLVDAAFHEKKAHRLRREGVKYCRKYALYTTEFYQLIGNLYGLLGNAKKAVKHYKISLTTGERLGAEIEQGRTYFEIGKCLSNKTLKSTEIEGKTAVAYLEKAKAVFEKYHLNWDLLSWERFLNRER